MTTTVADLKLHLIQPHASNVRRDLGDLDELTDSIRAQGILQPLVVAPFDGIIGQYVIIAGHRRHAAAQAAGLLEVPCVIRHDLTTQAKQITAMLTENLQRADLTVLEEALAYEQLDLLGLTASDMAKATGRSRRTVEGRLRLMRLPENARAAVDAGQLTLDDADELAKHADDPEIMAAVAKEASAVNMRWTVRRILMDREHAALQAQRAAEPDHDEPEPDQAQAERQARQATYEQERAAREQRRQVLDVSRASTLAHVLDRWKAGDKALPEQLAKFLLVDAIRQEYDGLEPFGITPPDNDADEADWLTQLEAMIRKMPAAKAIATCLASQFTVTGIGYPWSDNLALFADLTGYQLSDDEQALIAQDTA